MTTWMCKQINQSLVTPPSHLHYYQCSLTSHFDPQAFQRQVHERLTQLELVNKQYRRLARENRTDAASKLKDMVHDGNQRWDSLQRRVAAILRRTTVRRGGAE